MTSCRVAHFFLSFGGRGRATGWGSVSDATTPYVKALLVSLDSVADAPSPSVPGMTSLREGVITTSIRSGIWGSLQRS